MAKTENGKRGKMRDGIRTSVGRTGRKSYQVKVANGDGAKWQTFATHEAATRARDALRGERNAKRLVLPNKLTLGEWLDRYVAERQGIRETSRLRYRLNAERIKRALGDTRLQRLTPEDVRRFRDKSLVKLANETRVQAFGLLRAALREAADSGALQGSPAARVEPVKREQPVRRHVLSPADVADVLRHLAGHEAWLPAAIMAFTGMRRGEVCGLTRGALDFERCELTVGQNVQRLGARLVVNPPKTENSRRVVSITPELADALRSHLDEQARKGRELRLAPSPAWYVFQAPKGEWNPLVPRCPVALAEAIKWKLRGSRFADFSPHDFRHAHATDLLRHGAYPKAVAARLGDSVATVMRSYSHLVDGDDARLAGEALRRIAGHGGSLPGAPSAQRGEVVALRPAAAN